MSETKREKIQRWELFAFSEYDNGETWVEAHEAGETDKDRGRGEDGDWCKSEDVEKLEAENAELLKALKGLSGKFQHYLKIAEQLGEVDGGEADYCIDILSGITGDIVKNAGGAK